MATRSAAIQIKPPSSTASTSSSPRPIFDSISNSSKSPQQTHSTNTHPFPDHSRASNLFNPTTEPPNKTNGESDGTLHFQHQSSPTISTGRKSSPSSPRKFSLPHPTRPATAAPGSSGGAGLTTNAPVFVPSGSVMPYHLHGKTGPQIKLNKSAAEFSPSGLVPPSDHSALYNPSNPPDPHPYPSSSSTPYPNDPSFHTHNPYVYEPDRLLHAQANHSLTDAYVPHDGFIPHTRISAPSLSNFQRPLNYHLYAPPLPHSSNHHPHQLALNRFFMPASIRETLQKKSAATLQGPTHEVARTPEDLGAYHSLVVLDAPHATTGSHHPMGGPSTNSNAHHQNAYSSRVLKNPCWVYKAFCSLDGKAYCLYRVEGVRLKQGQGEAAIGQVDRWRKIRHPALVNVREAFTTRAFGDHSILVVYDYHPLSQTLYDEHISPKRSGTRTFEKVTGLLDDYSIGSLSNNSKNLNSKYNRHRPPNSAANNNNHHQARAGSSEERIIWSYIIQIANAIKAVHAANLAVRTIDSTKIILTGANRVRINGCGILDVTEYSANQMIEELQAEDLRDLGSLICSLASASICTPADPMSLSKGVEYVKQFYSQDLFDLVSYLLAPLTTLNHDPPAQDASKSIDGLLQLLWKRSFDELANVFNHNDVLEECLSRELENGRLVRLMVKLGFINERPEFDHDPNWSETSERYLLKLFRDYVFHQVDTQGKPVTDLSHVLLALNKLDASSDEKISLISRDDQTCAIVSFAEIRRIMDAAFRDLSR